jgi:spermidine synthase
MERPANHDDSREGTRALGTIFVLFFLSGACTLVYQVVWVRMLVLDFGASVYAVSTVLTAFMAGLALGSFGFGRVADRKINGLRVYAYVELLAVSRRSAVEVLRGGTGRRDDGHDRRRGP